MEKIKVLVVDDSALMRKVISDIIEEDEEIKVIGTARNGEDLLHKLSKADAETMPDVITLDVEMPIMDGITVLKEMKKRHICIPTIILSSDSKSGTKLTMECLEQGAFDFLPKPSRKLSIDIYKVKDELIRKIKISHKICKIKGSTAKIENKKTVNNNVKIDRNKYKRNIQAIVIGASTGGPKAIYSVITNLPENMGVPVFIVQHMPVGFTKAFSERLDANSKQKVIEAEDNMKIVPNRVYVAPGGYHMEVLEDKRIHLNKEPSIWGVRPAVDKLFISASKVYKRNLVSVVLTGMGKDGAHGTEVVKDNGGITISEDKSTCTIYGMPKVAYETGKVDMVLKLDEIADKLVSLVSVSGR